MSHLFLLDLLPQPTTCLDQRTKMEVLLLRLLLLLLPALQ